MSFRIIVKAAAGLLPKQICLDHLLLNEVRSEAWFVKELVVNGLRHGKIHVDTDKVHQFERPHREAVGLHDAVDLLVRSRAVSEQSKCLAIKISRNTVNDKSRCIARQYRCFAELLDVALRTVHYVIARLVSAHDFDELHDMRRIEEVQTEYATRFASRTGNG